MRMSLFFLIVFAAAHPGWSYIQDSTGVPMRDSVKLGTDLYFPSSSGPPWPALVQRTPYARDWDVNSISYITDVLGYALVVQNLRGYGDSGGEPLVFFSDGWGTLQDGYDAIEWVAAQSWSNSRTGMIGASAHGMTQYFAAGARPPHLTCAVPMVAGPSMYHHSAFTGGEFRKALVETWLSGLGNPWLIDSVVNHPDYDTLWSVIDLGSRWDSVTYPLFHITGWYDMFTDGQLTAFSELDQRFHNQKLFVGPWGHSTWNSRYQGDLVYPANAEMSDADFWLMMFTWYNHWIKDTTSQTGPRVKYYLMGDCDDPDTTRWNRWVETDTWPPSGIQPRDYYFAAPGALDTVPPDAPAAYDSFTYDPADPSPTYGGREFIGLSHGYGPIDQAPVESRPDVLIYSTPVLAQPLTVLGKLKCRLYAASDRFDTDWSIRVTDVYPDGRSILVTDNVLMARHRHGFDRQDSLVPGQPDTFDIDVWSTAHVFNSGHRVRVIVSSSNYPRFEKNPNTGAPFMRDDPVFLSARQKIYRESGLPSRIILPVLNQGSAEEEHGRSSAGSEFPRIKITSIGRILKVSCGVDQGEVEIIIFDAAGRRIDRFPITGRPGQARTKVVSGLATGVYFVKVDNGIRIRVYKVVIVR
jgi:predicted acyl esterase